MYIKLTTALTNERVYAAADKIAYVQSSEVGRQPLERAIVSFGDYEGSLCVQEEPHVILHRIRRALEGRWPVMSDPRWEEQEDVPE